MKKSFKVYLPKGYSRFILTGFFIIMLVPIIFTIIDKNNWISLIVFFLLFWPFLPAAIWSYRFKIIVKNKTITVKRGIGKEYSFNVNEITKVVHRINKYNQTETLVKITIYTKRKKVSVESLMIGMEKMSSYITENVDSNKIITKERVWR